MATDRREALRIIGAVGVTCAFPFSADELYGQTEDHAAHALVQLQQAKPSGPRYFGESEWKLVSRLSDLIIPGTTTPGAVMAGVPAYIDNVIGRNETQQVTFRKGAEWLRQASQARFRRDFLSLTEEQQVELLTPLCEAADKDKITTDGERFFAMVKRLTSDGYFTSKIGLMDTLAYQGNALVPDFHGCTHEH